MIPGRSVSVVRIRKTELCAERVVTPPSFCSLYLVCSGYCLISQSSVWPTLCSDFVCVVGGFYASSNLGFKVHCLVSSLLLGGLFSVQGFNLFSVVGVFLFFHLAGSNNHGSLHNQLTTVMMV